MNDKMMVNGWKLTARVIFLGPVALFHHLLDFKSRYGFAKYVIFIIAALSAISAYLSASLYFNPYIVGLVYLFLLFVLFGLSFVGCWLIDSKLPSQKQSNRPQLNLSRALIWMFFFGIFFVGLANIARIGYFWVLGEQISVHFSSQMDLFYIWIPIGFIYGFIYGINDKNTYANKNLFSLLKSILLLLFIISAFSFIGLMFVVYPLQRLTPISYNAQFPDFLFYLMLVLSIPFFIAYIMQRASIKGFGKSLITSIIFIPLITLHCVVLSGYAVTLTLTYASLLEDNQKLSEVRDLYSKTIPYIKHQNLLSSLHHRLGVLNVINEDYEEASKSFKKVMADYSDDYEVYEKAKSYLESFNKNTENSALDKTILNVQHQTFEQAASCFPNSLSVILNFYEENPISTRSLSYSIKEGFDSGSFIWKAEAFLKQNNYELITTLWQNKNILIRLLESDYPVLIYNPGHVYTLYGYDAKMEMFFTYDTAQSNRWNDNTFHNFQKGWMDSSFLMSVVVNKKDILDFRTTFPELFKSTDFHQLWQKTNITRYYEETKEYWIDYDPYKVSAQLGMDLIKTKDTFFSNSSFSSISLDTTSWDNTIMPIWENSWAIDWALFREHILFLLDQKEISRAEYLMKVYVPHFNKEYTPSYKPLLELQLALNLATDNTKQVISLSDNLIGAKSDQYEDDYEQSYWGYYYKGKDLIEKGEVNAALELLLPIIQDINLKYTNPSTELKAILELLTEIIEHHPNQLEETEEKMIAILRISQGMIN